MFSFLFVSVCEIAAHNNKDFDRKKEENTKDRFKTNILNKSKLQIWNEDEFPQIKREEPPIIFIEESLQEKKSLIEQTSLQIQERKILKQQKEDLLQQRDEIVFADRFYIQDEIRIQNPHDPCLLDQTIQEVTNLCLPIAIIF